MDNVVEYFLFAGSVEYFAAGFGLHLTDLCSNPGPLVQQFQNLEVKFIDLNPKLLQVRWIGVFLARHGRPVDARVGMKFLPEYPPARIPSTNRFPRIVHNL
jgi:hypothetical protein